jgi:hypothetical protein
MDKLKPLIASWLRSYVAAALAVYMSGGNLQAMAMGGIAAIVPVVLRYLNPNDAAFGVQSK